MSKRKAPVKDDTFHKRRILRELEKSLSESDDDEKKEDIKSTNMTIADIPCQCQHGLTEFVCHPILQCPSSPTQWIHSAPKSVLLPYLLNISNICPDVLHLIVDYAIDSPLFSDLITGITAVAEKHHHSSACTQCPLPTKSIYREQVEPEYVSKCLQVDQMDSWKCAYSKYIYPVLYPWSDCITLHQYSLNWKPLNPMTREDLIQHLLSLDEVVSVFIGQCGLQKRIDQWKTFDIFAWISRNLDLVLPPFPLTLQNAGLQGLFSMVLQYPFTELDSSRDLSSLLEQITVKYISTFGVNFLDHYLGPAIQNILLNFLKQKKSTIPNLDSFFFQREDLPWYNSEYVYWQSRTFWPLTFSTNRETNSNYQKEYLGKHFQVYNDRWYAYLLTDFCRFMSDILYLRLEECPRTLVSGRIYW